MNAQQLEPPGTTILHLHNLGPAHKGKSGNKYLYSANTGEMIIAENHHQVEESHRKKDQVHIEVSLLSLKKKKSTVIIKEINTHSLPKEDYTKEHSQEDRNHH